MSSVNRLGLFASLGAYFIWGCLPLYVRALSHIGEIELLVHRVIWSLASAVIMLALAANWSEVRRALTWKRFGWLCLSGVLIGGNWLAYIWAVGQERTMEAALGYYINPLVNVLFGLIFFSERLRLAQWGAVALAALGVGIMTVAYGHVPWIALFLCFSFAFYSLIRKQVDIDSRAGFLIEVIVLFPFAISWLVWFAAQPGGHWFGTGSIYDIILLLAAGPFTAIPLILFAIGAKRLNLSTIGMLQYIGPTLQFLIATFVFHEPFGWVHALAFGCIWAGLALFTGDSFVNEAKAKRAAQALQSV